MNFYLQANGINTNIFEWLEGNSLWINIKYKSPLSSALHFTD